MDQREFSMKIVNKTDFLHVRAGGMRSREVVQDLALKVFNTAVENQLSKVLIDVRDLVGYFGFMDIFYLVREVLQDLRGKGVEQIAVVDIQRSVGQGWFLEPVSQSYGVNIRVFAEEESAQEWLGV